MVTKAAVWEPITPTGKNSCSNTAFNRVLFPTPVSPTSAIGIGLDRTSSASNRCRSAGIAVTVGSDFSGPWTSAGYADSSTHFFKAEKYSEKRKDQTGGIVF